jgi:group I intron endonuclease
MRTGYIYKITNPTGRVYIGKTIRPNDRISFYRNINSKKTDQKILGNSILKYGWDNHIFEIIDQSPAELLNELEIKYIKKYNSFHYDNQNGMNLTRGGEGTLGRIPTPEQKNKLSKALKGKKHSIETRQLMSSLKIGKSSNFKGHTHTIESKQKISLANKSRPISKDAIQNTLNTKLINLIKKHESILQIDPKSNIIIKEWKILPTDIARTLNVDVIAIRKCLNNKNKTGAGYIWKYKNE